MKIKGIDVEILMGSPALAYPKNEALHLVSLFEKKGIPILGGDVYFLIDGRLDYFGDDWYFDGDKNVEFFQYATQSCMFAREFITNFKYPNFTSLISEEYKNAVKIEDLFRIRIHKRPTEFPWCILT